MRRCLVKTQWCRSCTMRFSSCMEIRLPGSRSGKAIDIADLN